MLWYNKYNDVYSFDMISFNPLLIYQLASFGNDFDFRMRRIIEKNYFKHRVYEPVDDRSLS